MSTFDVLLTSVSSCCVPLFLLQRPLASMHFKLVWVAATCLQLVVAAPGGSGQSQVNLAAQRVQATQTHRLSARAAAALCNLLPDPLKRESCHTWLIPCTSDADPLDAIATPCKPCKRIFSDPFVKTCTVEEVTSCSKGRLVISGEQCVETCPSTHYADSRSEFAAAFFG